ncbi:MAG TPA: bacillithiol biosynthesis deacetylase BshB1 [Vicinamibacterales bacterium]|jgi:N-acetylglucosamine malate deacetylase 1|nr:bacillithiol biosynthesis deacetylase BshB1 [Vicinamibacterales bacterium]
MGLDQVELLVFGPHPDDLEIGAGGTVAKHAAMGLRVGLVDLTQGEMGSNGTVEERLAEAEEARKVLGAMWRTNLRLPDRAIGSSADHALAATELIRRVKPKAITIPYWSDRHPDHVAASALLADAIFNAGLRRFRAEGEPWKPEMTSYYFINESAQPSFVVDVTEHYETKRRALACHKSQFRPPAADAVHTRLTSPRFMTLIESRDAQFGVLAGVDFAEGFVIREPVIRPHLLRVWDR